MLTDMVETSRIDLAAQLLLSQSQAAGAAGAAGAGAGGAAPAITQVFSWGGGLHLVPQSFIFPKNPLATWQCCCGNKSQHFLPPAQVDSNGHGRQEPAQTSVRLSFPVWVLEARA